MARRVLLTGSTGYLGAYLLEELRRRAPDLDVVTLGRRECDVAVDLADVARLCTAIAAARPWGILNAAAMATIGACEREPELAHRVNAMAPAVLAEALAESGGKSFVQVSTDLVFDGRAAPYASAAAPSPLAAYGRTKAAGERGVLAAGAQASAGFSATVVRVPLLFGPSRDGRRGATDMIRHAWRGGQSLTLFTNEYRTPLHAADAARALVDLLLARRAGVVHLAGERVSRHELGLRFAAVAGVPAEVILAGSSQDPARPSDVSLVNDLPPFPALADSLRRA